MVDPIKIYFKDIKHIPLLSAEEEVELAKRIKVHDKEAEDKLIKSNLRLVINIAKRYRHFGIPLMDLIEEGNLGLMRSVKKFNPFRGYRFSTYASWWIRQYISRALANQGKVIRIPVYMIEKISKYKKADEELLHKLHRKPRPAEIAKKMGMTIEKVRQIRKLITEVSSLEAPIGGEETAQLIDLIEDENTPPPNEDFAALLMQEGIRTLLQNITPKQRKVLELRYGLKDGAKRTLEEVASHYKITRERVRQIEQAALRKLKKMLERQAGVG